MKRLPAVLCAATLIAAAAYFAFGVIRPSAEQGFGFPAYDIYAYFYPNVRYALDSLARGSGLLWNPYQDCGQPFFALSLTGLLYPINLVFAFLPREPALLANMVLNLSIGGLGAWWLGREMGLSRVAALAGALAFEVGGSALMLAAWSPMHIGPYAWLPAALAAVERLLRDRSRRDAVLLGVILTVQLLPGFPQISVFTYQMIVLRVGWEFATTRVSRPLALLALLGVGLVLPPLLAAVQLLPSLEVARDSVRRLPLRLSEIGPGRGLTEIRASFGLAYFFQGAILTAALSAVALLGLGVRATRRLTVFYLAAASLYLLLAVGDATPLFGLYLRLPGGSVFRGPDRFLWLASFALAMTAGLGVEAIRRRPTRHARLAAPVAVTAGIALFCAFPPHILAPSDIIMLAPIVIAILAALWRPAFAPAAGVVVASVIAVNGVLVGAPFLNHRLGDLYGSHAELFERVHALLTPQDRVVIIGMQQGLEADLSLTHKIATLYHLPSIFDYEPQASRRYAQYFTFMRMGRPMNAVYDWYHPYGGTLPPSLNRRLFDLTAARYLIVDQRVDHLQSVLHPPATVLLRDGAVTVYENPEALPRAFFVPRMRRVREERVLPLLAEGRVDPRRVALVGGGDGAETGGSPDGEGTATIVGNDPQNVVVDVDANTPGYLFLADQYAPGWHAEVNGAAAEILPANHAFRLVAVPAGHSRVVFRYRPRSLWVGAGISLATGLMVVLFLRRGRRVPAPPGTIAVPPNHS